MCCPSGHFLPHLSTLRPLHLEATTYPKACLPPCMHDPMNAAPQGLLLHAAGASARASNASQPRLHRAHRHTSPHSLPQEAGQRTILAALGSWQNLGAWSRPALSPGTTARTAWSALMPWTMSGPWSRAWAPTPLSGHSALPWARSAIPTMQEHGGLASAKYLMWLYDHVFSELLPCMFACYSNISSRSR